MKKKMIQRGLLGCPLGVFIGYAITILISFFRAGDEYVSCVPALVEEFGSEINAVAFQAILCGLLGASFGAASLIWEEEKWSIAKQTGIYFLVVSVTMLPVAYFARWMERSVSGVLLYAGIFSAIFVLIWVIQYSFWRNKVKSMNRKIKEKDS